MIAFKNILVPVDFGEPSRRALEVAIALAKQNGAALTVLHVFDVPPSYASMDLSPMDLLAPMWSAAQAELDATLAKVKGALPNATHCLTRGTPWREILATIDRTHPDLVVVGTHGRTGLERALLGSVAERIVRLSPVPVLTVPPARDGGASIESGGSPDA
ncbi:MAG: hypothetical protein BGO98_13840 [Myxococcales bacterium 68-20]|nr:MAG: hypothetical protein BGO98_13840 [Myxococcales bacterium 68-20]